MKTTFQRWYTITATSASLAVLTSMLLAFNEQGRPNPAKRSSGTMKKWLRKPPSFLRKFATKAVSV